jgi:hypothetical protein
MKHFNNSSRDDRELIEVWTISVVEVEVQVRSLEKKHSRDCFMAKVGLR